MNDSESLREKANIAFREGRIDEALALYKEAGPIKIMYEPVQPIVEERPNVKLKKLLEQYSVLARQIRRDYTEKKITAVEAWNMLPAPEPTVIIIPTCTTQPVSNGYKAEYDCGSDSRNFLANLMYEMAREAWNGNPPWDLQFHTLHQKAEWFDKHLREGRDRRAKDIYHELKKKADEYERKIKEQDDLENAIVDKREADKRRKARMEAYIQYYETNPDAWKEKTDL